MLSSFLQAPRTGYQLCTQVRKFTSMSEIRNHWTQRDGEHKWLEEVASDEALEWVRKGNDEALKTLGDPNGTPLYNRILSILDSKDKIPSVRRIGTMFYNLWQDAENPRGLWRRTTLEDYPNKWETVLDIDALCKAENESWVAKGFTVCNVYDDPDTLPSRCLVKLSRGGADATVVREFDLDKKEFVEDNAFFVPECKSSVSWKSPDVLLIGTNFGNDGSEMTDSGYARTIHEWQRGTPLNEAPLMFEGTKEDVAVHGWVDLHGGHKYEWRQRALSFYTNLTCVRKLSENSPSEWVELNSLPSDSEVSQFSNTMLISLRSEWSIGGKTYPSGSLLSVLIEEFIENGVSASSFEPLFVPTSTTSLEGWTRTKSYLVLEKLESIKSRLEFWQYDNESGWKNIGEEAAATIRGISIGAVDSRSSDDLLVYVHSFTQPTTLSYADASRGPSMMESMTKMKELTPQFNADGLVCQQFSAKSADGTDIPYFIVHRDSMKHDGNNPTLLYGYGGFEVSLTPSYLSVTGAAWMEAGGVYVNANIRGGGEFGPSWHQAALKANRQKAYDDFIAVAEDLIARNITSSDRLGIRGGSNGGLLMGNMYVQRPELFKAVVCQVPLLDMKRFSHLLAGASWMAEYGNPDTEDWEFMEQYSAYHNIDPAVARGEGKAYPSLLMTTSTRDDRVHPYHARSFVKRLQENSTDKSGEVIYYENIEGGHGGAADSKQQAFMTALYINFLRRTIGNGVM